jgi:CheY-like chemotaxis protein
MARILLIDDEPQLRTTLILALKRAGHQVHSAGDGEEGIAFLASRTVDIVITDIMMPRKEGIETIIELRKLYPDIKIVAISGGGRTGNVGFLEMAKKFGAAHTLAKPFTMKALVDCVRDLEPGSTDGAAA